MAIIASNGDVEVGREVRSDVEEESKSPAPREEEVEDWI
jgi:hypothetical protein